MNSDLSHCITISKPYLTISGWWFQPSWKIWVRQWEGLSHIIPSIMESHEIHVPNHQPASPFQSAPRLLKRFRSRQLGPLRHFLERLCGPVALAKLLWRSVGWGEKNFSWTCLEKVTKVLNIWNSFFFAGPIMTIITIIYHNYSG
jgi:hypothetical protein